MCRVFKLNLFASLQFTVEFSFLGVATAITVALVCYICVYLCISIYVCVSPCVCACLKVSDLIKVTIRSQFYPNHPCNMPCPCHALYKHFIIIYIFIVGFLFLLHFFVKYSICMYVCICFISFILFYTFCFRKARGTRCILFCMVFFFFFLGLRFFICVC